MIYEGKAALLTFLTSLLLAGYASEKIDWERSKPVAISFSITLTVAHAFTLYYVAIKRFQIFWRAYFIGLTLLLGWAIISYASSVWRGLGLYLCVLAFFHISEYLATAAYNPGSLRLESFLINHSFAYNVAHIACCLEYAIWCFIFPGIKLHWWVQAVGMLVCISGEIFRKTAMYTAGTNFTHVIQYEKKTGHVLVTSGVYSLCRHPSYAGWFYWSIGTQILACNPLCFFTFSLTAWKFFDERIYEEEMLLLNFFKGEYLNYQSKVPSGVPFVKGYQLSQYVN